MSIRVEHIRKRFGEFTALDDVTLDFPTGELTALLGPSGCGKTSLLRIIAGLDAPDEGRVFLHDRDVGETRVGERKVGFVFQHYALFRHMSVFENIAFGLRSKPRSQRAPEADIRKRVQELLELVQLDWMAARLPSQLSGGQRQRVALARALAVEPQVLLLDEPFGALDAKVRKELRRWLRRLHDELHVTSILVTHDQEEALEVADRVVLMNHGKVEQADSPARVYEQPASPFVYGFLGSVNLFRGRVDGRGLVLGDQVLPLDPGQGLAPGRHGVAYVRPHELEIVSTSEDGGLKARVQRILGFGPIARIELTPVSCGMPDHVEVELPAERFEELGLKAGDVVGLRPRAGRIYPDGEA